jgi:hypothetical protein
MQAQLGKSALLKGMGSALSPGGEDSDSIREVRPFPGGNDESGCISLSFHVRKRHYIQIVREARLAGFAPPDWGSKVKKERDMVSFIPSFLVGS